MLGAVMTPAVARGSGGCVARRALVGRACSFVRRPYAELPARDAGRGLRMRLRARERVPHGLPRVWRWCAVRGHDWHPALADAALLVGLAPRAAAGTTTYAARAPPPRRYAALVDCAATMSVSYSLTWTQASGSQLGYDEVGIDAMYVTVVLLWGAAIALRCWFRRRDGMRGVLLPADPLARTMGAAAVLWFVMGFCGMVHWSTYAGDGVGVPGFALAAEAAGLASYLALTRVVISVANGFYIVNDGARHRKADIAFAGIVVFYAVTVAVRAATGTFVSRLYFTGNTVPVLWAFYHIFFFTWVRSVCCPPRSSSNPLPFAAYLQFVRSIALVQLGAPRPTAVFYSTFSVVGGMWVLTTPFIFFVAQLIPSYTVHEVGASCSQFFDLSIGLICVCLRGGGGVCPRRECAAQTVEAINLVLNTGIYGLLFKLLAARSSALTAGADGGMGAGASYGSTDV